MRAKEQPMEKSSSGFFGFGRKSSSKKKSSRGLNGSGSGSGTSTRRVVKATAPPPLPDPETTALSESTVLVDYPDTNNGNDTSSPEKKDIGNLPSVQKEEQLEKTEQWRQERLNANAAMRKENKEKDVMEHRKRSGSVENSGAGGGEEANVPQPVPAILSVAPKFPEHKRKAAPDDHVGKKSRVSEDADDDDDGGNQSTDSSWKEKIPGWMKSYGPAAAVAAAGAIIAMTFIRKR